MGRKTIPVLWVTGAPGVGKSTTGWGLYTRIAARGGSVGYVDIDQLGLIGPPPGGGSAGHGIKAANLLRVIGTLRRAGVRQVVVSGVVDPELGIGPHFEGRPEIELTLVRLRCERDELRRRFLGRGSPAELLEELFEVVDRLERSGFGIPLDTTGQSSDATVDALLERCVVAPGPFFPPPGGPLPGPVIVVTGPTAVGKSTAAWGVLQNLWKDGVPTAYADLDQLGFAPDSAVAKANLAEVWQGYRDAGARALIVVTREPGEVPGDLCVGLDADAATLADRVRRRAAGESALLAGDELRGVSTHVQQWVAERAVAEADRLRRSGTQQVLLDTTGQSAEETSADLLDAVRPALEPR
ncbi:hypothetical protein [Saccharopolyspora taberi]|uniref:Uncharacterized protein n=1 Tax=Saccharopolyspora taberi TaxID=60895 RepID=A0ABN3VMI4_9PSEU